MKQLSYEYRVNVELQFTRQEVEHLLNLATHHYDAKCRAAAIPGPGAFLNGMRVSLDLSATEPGWPGPKPEDLVTCVLTRHELDTLCKITESEMVGRPLKVHLYWPTRQVLKAADEEYKRLNEPAKAT